MAFEYNEIDIDEVKSVQLTTGKISPNVQGSNKSTRNLSKEQKRKTQLVDLLEDEFDTFHLFLHELLELYDTPEESNQLISVALNTPDYYKCGNCSNLGESVEGEPICLKSGKEKEGEMSYKVIHDRNSIPSFCTRKMRNIEFPKELLDETNKDLLAIAEEGYEQKSQERLEEFKKRRQKAINESREYSRYVTEEISDFVITKEEYTTRKLRNLLSGLYNPRDFKDYRQSAIRVAWQLHLGDTLEEEFYIQRAEAYLRAMESPYQNEKLPGQGGDEFEQKFREYLRTLNFPMFERVFKLEGVDANRKEMDIYTELPWGERAIFEIYTTGAHSEKDTQIEQYAELLKMATGIEPVQILLRDTNHDYQKVNKDLLFDLLQLELSIPDDLEQPSEQNRSNWLRQQERETSNI